MPGHLLSFSGQHSEVVVIVSVSQIRVLALMWLNACSPSHSWRDTTGDKETEAQNNEGS